MKRNKLDKMNFINDKKFQIMYKILPNYYFHIRKVAISIDFQL